MPPTRSGSARVTKGTDRTAGPIGRDRNVGYFYMLLSTMYMEDLHEYWAFNLFLTGDWCKYNYV